MTKLRIILFALGLFEVWAAGVNCALHYWKDAAGEFLGAAAFFTFFFLIPHLRRWITEDAK